MSEDKLIPQSGSDGGSSQWLPAERQGMAAGPSYEPDPYYPGLEGDEAGLDWRRYLRLPLRYKWLFVVALLVAGGASYWVWSTFPIVYRAEGNLWIEAQPGRDGPIRAGELLEGNAWIQLLRSYSVLDEVVVGMGLYVQAPPEYSDVFRTLKLADTYTPATLELEIGPAGDDFVLATPSGVVVQEGRIGESIGQSLGYEWTPPPGSFPAGEVIPFAVQAPRTAAQTLSAQLRTSMDQQGNFLSLELEGTDPVHITEILNALMVRHVTVSAELKRARLDETLDILEEQLGYTEAELARAEQNLEEWRVATISLPSDRSPAIAPGLELTRNPVFSNFFEMRIQAEQLRRDRAALEQALNQMEASGVVPIESLELIQPAAASSELRRILADLVDLRSEVRVLRDRYADDYPPLQELLVQMETIETVSVPQVVRGIVAVLDDNARIMEARVGAASVELQSIPPRTIEEARLERSVQITESLYNDLRGRVETQRLASASSIPDVRILDRPQVPQVPVQDDRIRVSLLILLGCLGAAMGGAVVLDQTHSKFRYATDVSREIGLGILGSIPKIHGGRGERSVMNAAQALEAFRELRIHVGFAYGSAGPITVAITSPSAGEGKSLISSNLAVAFAEVGRRTLLIDGDTRRGDAHRLFGLEQSPGLIDYLKGRSGQEIIQETAHENLDFIGCGSRGTSTPELLASSNMAHFMGALKRTYDVIIVDCPPLASGGDPLILSTLTGNLAVVIRTGATDRQLTMAKLEPLSRLPIRVLGAILNDVDAKDGYDYYYSSYLPGYEPVPEEGDEDGVQLISRGESS